MYCTNHGDWLGCPTVCRPLNGLLALYNILNFCTDKIWHNAIEKNEIAQLQQPLVEAFCSFTAEYECYNYQ